MKTVRLLGIKKITKVAAIGATTIRFDVYASKKNNEKMCYCAVAGTDGKAQISTKLKGKTEETENFSAYFGKEFITFASKLSTDDSLEVAFGESSAILKAGGATIEVAYKVEDLSPFVQPKQEEVIGKLGCSTVGLKKALAQGGYAAVAGTERSFTEGVSFVPIKKDDHYVLKIEASGMANGSVSGVKLLGFQLANGTMVDTFIISTKRVGIINHLEGENVSIMVLPTMAIFSTSEENVVLPLFEETKSNAETLTLPSTHKLYFNGIADACTVNVKKAEILSALSTVQAVVDADGNKETAGKAVICTTGEGKLLLESANGRCHIEVPTESITGSEMGTIKFNPIFASKALSVADDVVQVATVELVNKAGVKNVFIKIRYGINDENGSFFAPLMN